MTSVIRGQDGFDSSSVKSMVRLNTANGYGSTNTKIRRFANVVTNQGTDIAYVDSATLGASFTINTAGVYSISFTDPLGAPGTTGISLNTANPTVSIFNCPVGEVLSFANAVANGFAGWTGYLSAGSVVRAHTAGEASSALAAQFTIVRVA